MNWFCKWLSKHDRHRTIFDRDGLKPYIERFYVLFKPAVGHNGTGKPFNVFLHNIKESDEPVYHDHPWWSLSIILKGGYIEHIPLWIRSTPVVPEGFITDVPVKRKAGSIIFRKLGHGRSISRNFHWLELTHKDTWTIFIHGPRVQTWGFLKLGKDGFGFPIWQYWRDYLKEKRGTENGTDNQTKA